MQSVGCANFCRIFSKYCTHACSTPLHPSTSQFTFAIIWRNFETILWNISHLYRGPGTPLVAESLLGVVRLTKPIASVNLLNIHIFCSLKCLQWVHSIRKRMSDFFGETSMNSVKEQTLDSHPPQQKVKRVTNLVKYEQEFRITHRRLFLWIKWDIRPLKKN